MVVATPWLRSRARIHTSRSSSVVRITGMAFGWIGSTIAFGDVVRKPQQPRRGRVHFVAHSGSIVS